jgi:hypothetical protein
LRVGKEKATFLKLAGREFKTHPVVLEDFSRSKYLEKISSKLCGLRPENYENLLATEGVGPKTIRALSLVAEVIYGAAASYEDPARYSFAHGGKDGTPYFVDRSAYDRTVKILEEMVSKAKLSSMEKDEAIGRLRGKASGWSVYGRA